MERRLFCFLGGFLTTIGAVLFLLVAKDWHKVSSYAEFEMALVVAILGVADIAGGILLLRAALKK